MFMPPLAIAEGVSARERQSGSETKNHAWHQ